jgi:hypothetical protein
MYRWATGKLHISTIHNLSETCKDRQAVTKMFWLVSWHNEAAEEILYAFGQR